MNCSPDLAAVVHIHLKINQSLCEIAGSSYRMQQHSKLVPETLQLLPVSTSEPAKKRRVRPGTVQEE